MVGFVHHNTVFRGFFDFGDDDGTFLAVGGVEGGQVCEGVFTDNIRVENEEGGVVFGENSFGKLEGAGGVEGLRFDGEGDFDVESFFVLFYRFRDWKCELGVRGASTSAKCFSITSGR